MSTPSSPWDGTDRRWLRVGIAVVTTLTILSAAVELLHAPVAGRANAPRPLLIVLRSEMTIVGLASVGVAGSALFGHGRRGVLGGVLLLGALGVLVEVRAAALGGPFRADFFAGVVVLGWLLGLAWARGDNRSTEAEVGRWAELGAVSLLAAAYVSAGLGKLLGAGAAWADVNTLRAVIVSHAEVAPTGGWRFGVATVVDHPAIARGFAIATVIVQLGAVGLPLGRRIRLVSATGLLGFHLGVAWLTGIGYWAPIALLGLFAFGARGGRRSAPATWSPPRQRWIGAGVIAAVVIGLAWFGPWRTYTRSHHRGGGSPRWRRPVEALGSVQVGSVLAESWTVRSIEREPERMRLVLTDADDRRAIVFVATRRDQPRSPYQTKTIHIAYGTTSVPLQDLDAALRALAAQLDLDRPTSLP